MKQFKYLIIAFLAFMFFIPNIFAEEKDINLYLFYGKECPHCEEMMEYLDVYLRENDEVHLYKYEVWHSEANQKKLAEVEEILDTDSSSVPFLVIGNDYIVGYSSAYTPKNIEHLVDKYQKKEYKDKVGIKLGVVEKEKKQTKPAKKEKKQKEKTFDVPILGNINAKDVSLPLLAVVLGFVDGFNPCALWVLIFLITMLIGMKDRKKMWLLGITFLLTSAIVYTLFMVSWLSFAKVMSSVIFLKFAIGMFAVIFGTYNVVRFIKSLREDDGCDIVDDKQRKKIITKIKNVVKEKNIYLALLGVMALAASVNMIELMCSLGLPVIYTQVLSLNDLNIIKYGICIFIYILFYLLDDLVIFVIAMKTLKIKAISNKYVKYSHLIGGLIMLALGLMMIIKPEWLMFNF